MFIPGKLTNPLNASRFGLWKHRRWARTRKETAEMCILAAVGRRHGIDPTAPKLVTFRAYVWNLFDSDGLQAALKPTRDALVSMGILSDDRESAGHWFVYEQIVSRRSPVKRGVEITVTELVPAR